MNPASEEHFEKLHNCKGRFTGDPAHEFECKTFKLVGEGEEEHLEEEVVSKRLKKKGLRVDQWLFKNNFIF